MKVGDQVSTTSTQEIISLNPATRLNEEYHLEPGTLIEVVTLGSEAEWLRGQVITGKAKGQRLILSKGEWK